MQASLSFHTTSITHSITITIMITINNNRQNPRLAILETTIASQHLYVDI